MFNGLDNEEEDENEPINLVQPANAPMLAGRCLADTPPLDLPLSSPALGL